MQFWFSRQSDVSIREQLVTQVVLAIVSGELAPAERLPSTRELARRFRLHPNTVSAGYRQLERNNWVEFKKGSGVYVRAQHPVVPKGEIALDQLIADFLRSTRHLGVPLATVRARLKQVFEVQPPDHFLLIEPDAALAAIVADEMQDILTLRVRIADLSDGNSPIVAEGSVAVALSISAKMARSLLPENTDLITLDLRSARESLARYLPASPSLLIGIASGWQKFLKNGLTMLTAAGFHRDSLIVRDTTRPGWQRGLKQAAAVVCDSLTAKHLNNLARVLVFQLLAEGSLRELKRCEKCLLEPVEG